MSQVPAPHPAPDSRRISWRRLASPLSGLAVMILAVAMVAQSLATVVSGRLADGPTLHGVVMLGVLIVGAAVVQVAAQVSWAHVIDRAAGTLRRDLLAAAFAQPLSVLSEQAVGEVLDRIDDDTNAINNLMREQWWGMMATALGAVPLWIVAGLMWWPAGIIMPVLVAATLLMVRPLFAVIAHRKVINEQSWTDHAAAFEEVVSARDDLRTSGGQAFAMRRVTAFAAEIHRTFRRMIVKEADLILRSQTALQAMFAGIVIAGVALVTTGGIELPQLITLVLATTLLIGRVGELVNQLPQLQEGLGAITRVKQMMQVEPEPDGGAGFPASHALEFRGLHFSYPEGAFALQNVSLSVEDGETLALVGRTGSGKSTLASLVTRATEPPTGTVLLGGRDVTGIDLQQLRRGIGVVTQRTELLSGTLEENISLFAPLPRERVEAAVEELGLTDWAARLPQGLDTRMGAGGVTLSAGEEQLVAFARLLVRDVAVVILDEATARMDPLTERRVIRASERLLAGRTGLLIAHRLTTVARADRVAVLDHGRVIQQGRYGELAAEVGPFQELLEASRERDGSMDGDPVGAAPGDAEPEGGLEDAETTGAGPAGPVPLGGARRRAEAPPKTVTGDGPSLTRAVLAAFGHLPRWGLFGMLMFLLIALFSPQGLITNWLWGRIAGSLASGREDVWGLVILLAGASVLIMPAVFALGVNLYPRWWVSCLSRHRTRVLAGQLGEPRLETTPPGEVVARAMDGDRIQDYADRWADLCNAIIIVLLSVLVSGTWWVGGVLASVLIVSAAASWAGRPAAGRSAKRAADARVEFGRVLVSALDAARTVKLSAATAPVSRHLNAVDSRRVEAQVREHRIQAVLDGVPGLVIAAGVTFSWAMHFTGAWGLATTVLASGSVMGFTWYGLCAGSVVTKAPGARAWQVATQRLAGGQSIYRRVDGVHELAGCAPPPGDEQHDEFRSLTLQGFSAVHSDGIIGVEDVDLTVTRGELILILGGIGSGKSSLLRSLAGLVPHRGKILWNGAEVTTDTFLRPRRVAYVAQMPRVLSGTFDDNIRLDHDRGTSEAVRMARMEQDISDAGGLHAVVGHRGVRLSGGQVQRLATARALATGSELLLADDVSSALDASTEVELWQALREEGVTVIGSTSKRAALARADRVVILEAGRVVAVGPWRSLSRRWAHLAG
ncbi:ATP-binding cassette domain-containing protein [Nesterenkonia xinjiangensis]|uniref:ATP-binding cassette domain-containing protein n=1 Tax=Nesterenkonia xinjiangensis TaxID=225327 RepID=UPI0015CCF250|nr:ABC transporter ATP-binding protein [Nesterenkonia xinjiangensis]